MVQGHPMVLNKVTDDNGHPKLNKLGEQQQQVFVAIAIPKGNETHWNQTAWGQEIYNAGVAAWPRGEYNAPTFAWKITDGDSRTPNRKGKIPAEREGFPGHWVIGCANGFAPDCYADRNYATQVIRAERFKTGDYIRLVIQIKSNESGQSPGMYVNIKGCELIQAGPEIVTASFDAQTTFGAQAAQLPAGALTDPNVGGVAGAQQQPANAAQSATQTTTAPAASVAPPPAQDGNAAAPPPPADTAAPAPAHDFLLYNGKKYTADQLRASKWTEEQIAGLPKA